MLAFRCFGDLKASLIYTNGVWSDVKVTAVQNGGYHDTPAWQPWAIARLPMTLAENGAGPSRPRLFQACARVRQAVGPDQIQITEF
jgi:hypothetical protein